jgi:nicotinamide-nucleotide amidase
MTAEIISVGTELLMGQVVDTNAAFLSRRLSGLGITLHRRATVGDNPIRLREAYETALRRADTVITSGGLGPTGDDITKRVLAELLGEPLIVSPEAQAAIEDRFLQMRRPMGPNNISQALFTADSLILPNANGTAPGAIVPCSRFGAGKVVIHLPGPPHELEPMFDDAVAAYLEERSDVKFISRYIRIFGLGESEVDDRLSDLTNAVNPSLSPYCSTGEVMLRATARCGSVREGEQMLRPLVFDVRNRLGDVVYAVDAADTGSLAATVISALKARSVTLAVCESLTGGMLASWLTDIPGASCVFRGGIITYTNEQKILLAGVQPQTLSEYGAASEACALEMAQGVRMKTGADMGISLTGCAGPDSDSRNTPVGYTAIGVAHHNSLTARVLCFSGSRLRIRTLACKNALDIIRREIL